MARRLQPFLPSSTRANPRWAPSAIHFIFLRIFQIDSKPHHGGIRTLGLATLALVEGNHQTTGGATGTATKEQDKRGLGNGALLISRRVPGTVHSNQDLILGVKIGVYKRGFAAVG